MQLDRLTFQFFMEHLNRTFQVEIPGSEPISLELYEVMEMHASPETEGFVALFRGPGDVLLRQGRYALEEPQFGRVELFLTAIGPDDQGMCYQAPFNRLRKPAGDKPLADGSAKK